MARASVQQEIHFTVPDETGILGRVASTLALAGVYIVHLSAYAVGRRAYFQLVTRDNAAAARALREIVKTARRRDVLVVEFENKVGTLAPVTRLLGSNRIGVRYVYGTSGDGFKIVGIFSTTHNKKAAEIINRESGALGVDPGDQRRKTK